MVVIYRQRRPLLLQHAGWGGTGRQGGERGLAGRQARKRSWQGETKRWGKGVGRKGGAGLGIGRETVARKRGLTGRHGRGEGVGRRQERGQGWQGGRSPFVCVAHRCNINSDSGNKNSGREIYYHFTLSGSFRLRCSCVGTINLLWIPRRNVIQLCFVIMRFCV